MSSSCTRLQNFFLPDQIDPSLQGPAGSWQVGQDDRAASNGDRNMNSQEDDDGYEGNTDDRSSEDSNEEAEPRRQHAPKRQIQFMDHNYSLMFLCRPWD